MRADRTTRRVAHPVMIDPTRARVVMSTADPRLALARLAPGRVTTSSLPYLASPAVSVGRRYVLLLVVLVVGNLTGNLWLPTPLYVPFNLAMAGGLILMIRGNGAGAAEVGLERSARRRGLLWGVSLGAAAVVVLIAASLVPGLDDLFADDRAAGIGMAGLLYQTLVRIPLGTAVAEEVAFRGVLLGYGTRIWSWRTSAIASSLLFGLWHVVPAVSALGGNAATDDVGGVGQVMLVAGAVGATAVAGALLAYVRRLSGGLVAPIILHAAINSTAFALAAAVVN